MSELDDARNAVVALRILVLEAECVDGRCAWCRADTSHPEAPHAEDCAVFTVAGVVRLDTHPGVSWLTSAAARQALGWRDTTVETPPEERTVLAWCEGRLELAQYLGEQHWRVRDVEGRLGVRWWMPVGRPP